MKHGEAPWFLMWCSALLFAFGMGWAWVVNISAAAILDMPMRSAFLVGAGVFGTVLGQFGMLRAWRRYVRAIGDNDRRPGMHSTAQGANPPDQEPSYAATKKRTEERA